MAGPLVEWVSKGSYIEKMNASEFKEFFDINIKPGQVLKCRLEVLK